MVKYNLYIEANYITERQQAMGELISRGIGSKV